MTPVAREEQRSKEARVLADAAMRGDAEAASKHGVSLRPVQKYRTRARRDPAKAAEAMQKIDQVNRDWTAQAQDDLKAMCARLRDMCAKVKPTPEGVHAVAGAIKILSEATNARVFLEAKLAVHGTTASLIGR